MAALTVVMVSMKDWIEGARLRTLPAAGAPVLIGAGAAWHLGAFSLGRSALALLVALSLQVGVNFANDYSDGKKGTDEHRVGPTRLTASGLVPPKTVLLAALTCFGVASVAGLCLVAWSGEWWLLGVGALAVAAAWFYTGGSKPYGYMGVGLSELFVFVFFGLVATVGTTYVQSFSVPWWLWLAAGGIGLVSIALLMVNNIRDIPTDRGVGKTTLAVRLGDRRSRQVYVGLILLSSFAAGISQYGAGASLWVSVGFTAVMLLAATPGMWSVARGATGHGLLPALRNTGLYALTFGVISGVGFALGAAWTL